MGRYSVFRDDDISVTTDIGLLMKTHDLIVSHGKIHTVAVLMESLWCNKEVWLFLHATAGLQVALHGWTHEDYSILPVPNIIQDINRSLDYWRDYSGAYPDAPKITNFLPPWNRVSPALEEACRVTGLTLDARWKGDTDVYGMHSWEMWMPERLAKLEKALQA